MKLYVLLRVKSIKKIEVATIKIYQRKENRLLKNPLKEALSKRLILIILIKKRHLKMIVLFLSLLQEIVKKEVYQIRVSKTIIQNCRMLVNFQLFSHRRQVKQQKIEQLMPITQIPKNDRIFFLYLLQLISNNKQNMIKLQEIITEQIFFCLNPFCIYKTQRKFKKQNRHFAREQCKKWIISSQQLCKDKESFNIRQINNIQVDFSTKPLQGLAVMHKLKASNWQKVLQSEEAKLRKEICRSIQIQFEAIKQKIQQFLQAADIYDGMITICSSYGEPSPQINAFYNENLEKLNSLSNKILFKKLQLKQKTATLKKQIQTIFQSMIEDKRVIEGLISQQQQRRFHEYIFEQTNEYYNKLQMLASAIKKKQARYHIQSEKMSLQCCVCSRTAQATVQMSNKKTVKKYLAEQILTHLYCSHYEEVAYAFSRKIEKTNISSIKFQDFLVDSKIYSSVIILDRQSGIAFEESYEKVSEKRYIIQIISIKNIHMAKGRHILVELNQSIDSLVAIIAYICTQRDQNVDILTNKPYLKKGIQNLMYCHQQSPKVKKQIKNNDLKTEKY